MKTYSPKPDHIERRWYVLDASGQVLGRLATHAATLLRGKHKPVFAPHMDTGDHVIVVNADKIELTGAKADTKIAYRHSGYPGGIRATPYGRILAERPVFAVEKAVRGMLPKNRLGRAMIRKLHVVAGPEHRHAAQKPIALAVGERPAWDGLPAGQTATGSAGGEAKAVMASSSRPATDAGPVKKPAARKAPAKPSARTTPARKTAAGKTTARKTTARKPTARKPTARKPTARAAATTSAKKPAAAKATAKKTNAKKSTTRARPTKDKG